MNMRASGTGAVVVCLVLACCAPAAAAGKTFRLFQDVTGHDTPVLEAAVRYRRMVGRWPSNMGQLRFLLPPGAPGDDFIRRARIVSSDKHRCSILIQSPGNRRGNAPLGEMVTLTARGHEYTTHSVLLTGGAAAPRSNK